MKNPMKALLIAGLTASLLLTSACRNQRQLENTSDVAPDVISDEVEVKLGAYKTDLSDSSRASASSQGMKDYLVHWAAAKGITCKTDKKGNVYMRSRATSGYEEAAPVVLVCPYDSRQADTYINPMAMALYAIKNSTVHSAFTVIFTPEYGNDFSGVQSLKKTYFPDDARVFVLNGSQKGRYSLNAGGSTVFRFTQKIRYRKPEYTKAYRITISNLEGGQSTTEMNVKVNPILRLQSLLTSLTSSNIPYELASISGGAGGAMVPTSCQMTIVVNADKEKQFITKMEAATDRFNQDKAKRHPGAVYNCVSVDLPKKVIATEDSQQFVNFMYTLLKGTYYKEDGNVITTNNITSVQSSGNQIAIGSVCYSLDQAKMNEVRKAERTLCGLSDAHYSVVRTIPIWKGPAEDSQFAKTLKTSYRAYTKTGLAFSDSIVSSNANYIQKINSKCQIVTLNVSANVLTDCTGSFMKFLIGNTPNAGRRALFR